MRQSTLITSLTELYDPFITPENNWVKQNSLILNYARANNLAFGGSIAMAISCKKAKKIPGDIDLFTNSNIDAMNFLQKVMEYLHNKKGSFYKIYVNNETQFTMKGVKSHYRIVGPPYWLPICVMVLKKPIRTFYWKSSPVQFFDDVVAAAKEVSLKDGKPRGEGVYEPKDDIIDLPYRTNSELIDVSLESLLYENLENLEYKDSPQSAHS